MSATMPAYCNAEHAEAAFAAAAIKADVFPSPCAETLRSVTRAAAPHIAYIRLDGFLAAPNKTRPQPLDEALRFIVESYTPAIDPDAGQGFYLNFFGSRHLDHDFPGTLRRLQLEVLKETGLNITIGAAATKVGAFVASRLNHLGGLRILTPGSEAAFFASLPVEALHGIGPIDAADLRKRGISTIAELRRVPLPALQSAYDDLIARQIWHHSRALDADTALPAGWSIETVLNFLASLLQDKSPCIASLI